jgi:hypothetical protein
MTIFFLLFITGVVWFTILIMFFLFIFICVSILLVGFIYCNHELIVQRSFVVVFTCTHTMHFDHIHLFYVYSDL